MKRFVLTAALLCIVAAAQAQIYKWQDQNNRTVISDRPPTGVVRKPLTIEAEAPPAAADAGKTMADREMDFRKRQKESVERNEKAEKEQRLTAQRQEDCDAARRSLQAMESGERVAMRDARGERYFLDDSQRQQEIARIRQTVQSNCK
ncbi:DUF4124 domain-containing protein [Accumulibacter sp.]|uniref:DUF4124 domain-containing protein n=1 Tax=Accumulibacter sp. TaxID=2053492 RepID=UPI002C0AE5EC|nr:DUF4124 domain-containing protein [Accumulibacter sp.]HPU79591.1 DUF4124 domain-containing protein [Accumulibacter sp.]